MYLKVITGGNYDVDVEMISSDGRSLYKGTKKQFGTFEFTTDLKGEYQFCFSNEFSTFTHKVVYFEFVAGEDEPINDAIGAHISALTQVYTSGCVQHCCLYLTSIIILNLYLNSPNWEFLWFHSYCHTQYHILCTLNANDLLELRIIASRL